MDIFWLIPSTNSAAHTHTPQVVQLTARLCPASEINFVGATPDFVLTRGAWWMAWFLDFGPKLPGVNRIARHDSPPQARACSRGWNSPARADLISTKTSAHSIATNRARGSPLGAWRCLGHTKHDLAV